MNKVLMVLSMVLLSAGWSGCAGLETKTQRVEASCLAAGAANNALVVAITADQLSVVQMKQVLAANNIIRPICGDPEHIPTLDDVQQQALAQAVVALQNLGAK